MLNVATEVSSFAWLFYSCCDVAEEATSKHIVASGCCQPLIHAMPGIDRTHHLFIFRTNHLLAGAEESFQSRSGMLAGVQGRRGSQFT